MKGEEWLELRIRVESLAKNLDRIYGPLVIIHLGRNAVLATVVMFFIVRSIVAFGLGTFLMGTYIIAFIFVAIPILIFHLAAEPVTIQVKKPSSLHSPLHTVVFQFFLRMSFIRM